MKNILKALTAPAWGATIILFAQWVMAKDPEAWSIEVSHISGWYWFACLMVALFLSNIDYD